MAASDALSGVQFRFFAANPRSMGGVPHHTVEAWQAEHADTEWAKARPEERDHYAGSAVDPGTRPVGSLSWHHQTGEIRGVHVVPEQRRQGIATGLLGQARATGVRAPRHSAQRTDSGEAWARSTGDRLPRRSRESTP